MRSVRLSLVVVGLLMVVASCSAAAAPDSGTWMLTASRGTIQGFADRPSVTEGDHLGLYVTTPATSFDVEIYRLGWYDGGASQARLIQRVADVPGLAQPPALLDPQSGLVSAANWTSNGSVVVEGWPTGLYLLKLTAADGDQSYIPVVVRDDVGSHDFLFEHADMTDQAYSGWGGKSLYDFNSSGGATLSGHTSAVQVSFDRPLDGNGAGRSLAWELNMVRWLEANGFDVSYVSDLNVHADPGFDNRVRAVLQAGHSEYWSKEMRDHFESARDRGKGLGFFTGDTGSWAIRVTDSPLGANRIIEFYGTSRTPDPVATTDPQRASTHFYDPPLKRPTQQLFGIGTNGPVKRSADWIAKGVQALPEVFANTGLQNGDVVPNLVGYEYDGLWTPGSTTQMTTGVQVIGSAPVLPERPLSNLLDLAARRNLDSQEQVQVGQLTAQLRPGRVWRVFVHMKAASGSWYLQYQPGTESPSQTQSGDTTYIIRPLTGFDQSGWQPLHVDLRTDFNSVAGPPPADLRVDALVLRGDVAIGSISLSAPGGALAQVTPTTDQRGWQAASGEGQVSVESEGPAGEIVLVLRPFGLDHPVDEAHSVAIHTPAGGWIFAAGTIQWSWALDDFGQHTDPQGNRTPVDQRIQALTRNILNALRGSG
jgi:hypothetical protein